METHLETIRVAVATGANAEQRAAGVAACRAILMVLEATPARPLESEPSSAAAIASMIGALRGAPITQALDLVIARLRAAMPAGESIAAPDVCFRLVTLPTKRPGPNTSGSSGSTP
jgi:hypothetical protein